MCEGVSSESREGERNESREGEREGAGEREWERIYPILIYSSALLTYSFVFLTV